eukprot:403337865
MQFTKTITFDKVLTDCLQMQERLLEHFTDIPLVSTNTKSYKDVSETVISQLKVVFDTYVLSSAAMASSMDNRNEKDVMIQQLNQINCSQNQGINSNNNMIQQELSSVHSQQSNLNVNSSTNLNNGSSSGNNHNFNQQLKQLDLNNHMLRNVDYQHQLQKTSASINSLIETNTNTNNNNLFLQTQEISAENDYLKKQIHALKSQIETHLEDQKQMMEETQSKDAELRELIEMVRAYEGQIRELQEKLEEQIYLHEQREGAKVAKQQYEIQAQQEIQQVKLLFQEFILVKDEIEKNLEDIVKRVLERDEQLITFDSSGNQESNNQDSKNQQLFTSQTTLQKFQEGFSSRKIQDIMRCEISEVKELLEVLKDLKNLINQMLQEKKQLKVQLQSELDLRAQIEKALENQELEGLSPDLLIMKIKTLEHVIDGIQSIFNNQKQFENPNGMNQQQSTQYLIYQQLKLFSTEKLDEKVRLQEKLRSVENQNFQMNEDLQSLLTRIEECERENTEMRIAGDSKIDEEKRKLLLEVEEIRQREEKLDQEIQQKLEEEIIRMQIEQEKELNEKFVDQLSKIMNLSSHDKNTHMRDFDEAIRYSEMKFKNLLEKIEVLTENKELLMQERMIFEERMTEFSYQNQMATKQVEQLHTQLQSTTNNYQHELQTLKDEKDQLNSNMNMLMSKFRQAASELHEVREEREKLKKEIQDLQEIIDNLERRNSMKHTLQSSAISSGNSYNQSNQLISSRPPLNKNENSLSPHTNKYQQHQEYSARSGMSTNTAVPQPRKQPIQIYNSVLNSLSKNDKNDLITPSYQGSLLTQQLRSSLDEKQLTNLINDYKSENMKFSQKVQELQQKIQNTAQLSPYKNPEKSSLTQSQRAASSRPLNQRNNNNMVNSQAMIQNARNDLNKQYFSTINTAEEISSARKYRNENSQQPNSGRSQNQRTLSCNLKKKQ